MFSVCPACNELIIEIDESDAEGYAKGRLVVPRAVSRKPVHKNVPKEIAVDFREASIVLNDSPKASAALSRRCLQALLIKQGAAKKKTLAEQLDSVLSRLPEYLQSHVGNIRKLGNIAAHPVESTSQHHPDEPTANIVNVESGEAEWMLEILEELFDHFYAKPAHAAQRQAALNKKFAQAKRAKPPEAKSDAT